MKFKIFIFLAVLLFWSCEKVLDKENLTAVNPDDVWNDFGLARAYVDNLYAQLMPGASYTSGGSSDEAPSTDGSTMSGVLKGTLTANDINYWPYATIRQINIFFEKVGSGTLTGEEINLLKGQAHFWRGWVYYNLVNTYGGVPLVLEPQDRSEGDALFVSRNLTSECIAQVIKDLDDAIALLPNAWTGGDYGRIDKGVAMAFKGRVLLNYASPRFTPSGDQQRWQNAYDANKAAMDFLVSKGKGLHPNYADIWYVEQNEEVVMVNQYYTPGHSTNQNFLRPLWATKDAVGGDRPSIDLVNAYPMADGSEFDASGGYDTYWHNRDDRFYASVAYPGSDYGIADLNGESYLWNHYYLDENGVEQPAETLNHGSAGGNNWTGFYRLKGADKDVSGSNINEADVDHVEIRFAEILMNYGEAANELSKTGEALDVLYQIRARAGISAGGGDYGIPETDQSGIRERYMKERFVEFAFEGHRFNDLRRWRRFDLLNDLGTRHGLRILLNQGETGPTAFDDIDDFIGKFSYYVFDVETFAGETFNLKDEYYFYAIPQTHLDQNSNLEQTSGWDGGTFDPIK